LFKLSRPDGCDIEKTMKDWLTEEGKFLISTIFN
jgi:hypothetical protein